MVAERPDLMPKVRDLRTSRASIFSRTASSGSFTSARRAISTSGSASISTLRASSAPTEDPGAAREHLDLEAHTVKSEPESLLLEGKLIKEYRPRYNVSFRDDKKFLLVKVNLNDPFPRFKLTRVRADDGAATSARFPTRARCARRSPSCGKIPHPHLPARNPRRGRLQALPPAHYQELLRTLREQDHPGRLPGAGPARVRLP